nr:ADP-ribosylglycohydrolase family protein [bacterium]
MKADQSFLSRAQGCLLGQLAGDALGGLVEFQTPSDIRKEYPDGVRKLADGGTWNTIAGQPTDDSEMALMLARMLVELGRYDPAEARKVYVFWLDSKPFDCGMTTSSGLRGQPNHDSQANGALMRVSPLGIFGAHYELNQVAKWARQDAALTHPHPVCQQVNALFTMAIAHTILTECGPKKLYEEIKSWAEQMDVEKSLLDVETGTAVRGANTERPVAEVPESAPEALPMDIDHLRLTAQPYRRFATLVNYTTEPHLVPIPQLAYLVERIVEIEGP